MKTKTLDWFIREHFNEIKQFIERRVPNHKKITYEECRLWVLNDEQLYEWALACDVDI